MPPIGPDIAISIRNLGKDFRPSFFKGDKDIVTAVSDLSLEIPKFGIYVLLGSNGYVPSCSRPLVHSRSTTC